MTDKPLTTPNILFKRARALAAKMRRSGKYSAVDIFMALEKAHHDGYAEGHEDQMRARILDRREYEQRLNGVHS